DLKLTNGETIHCYGQWWDGGDLMASEILGVELVPVTFNDVNSLEACYVYHGASGIKDKVEALVDAYQGRVFEYREFEKAYWNTKRVVEEHEGYTQSYVQKVKNPYFVNERMEE